MPGEYGVEHQTVAYSAVSTSASQPVSPSVPSLVQPSLQGCTFLGQLLSTSHVAVSFLGSSGARALR